MINIDPSLRRFLFLHARMFGDQWLSGSDLEGRVIMMLRMLISLGYAQRIFEDDGTLRIKATSKFFADWEYPLLAESAELISASAEPFI